MADDARADGCAGVEGLFVFPDEALELALGSRRGVEGGDVELVEAFNVDRAAILRGRDAK